MGPPEGPTNHPKNQERRPTGSLRRPRTRLCLLKGCAQRFRPQRASEQYCSDICRLAAWKWSKWKAQQRYRATKAGKDKRKAQSRRHRERVKTKKKLALEVCDAAARVISQKSFFDCSCDRPGCYEMFQHSRRSPLQRFCSKECRRALERVWERERRWQEYRAA